jgi:hypothetical protein
MARSSYNGQQQEDSFNLTSGFKSYVSKPEITALAPNFLVKGSKNVLIDYAARVISRNGYSLYRQANNGGGPIRSSYDWTTSTGKFFNLRSSDSKLEFDWNGTYNSLLTTLSTPFISFCQVLDFTEQTDVLLFVQSDSNMYRWSGGVSKVASSTATTLTKQGVMTGKTTIAFVAGTPGIVAPKITDSANGFVTAGFAVGDSLFVTGSTANSKTFTIGSVTAGTITLIMSNSLISESVGPSITIHNGEPTWKSARFFSSLSGRSLLYNGTPYTYTGGETTDTLTGLTAFPTVTAGDQVWQTVSTIALPSDITSGFPNFAPDMISSQLNQVVLGSTKSSMTFGSTNIDYTDFFLDSPRAPGDPFQIPLTSGPMTCMIPIDTMQNVTNIQSNFVFGSGRNVFDHLDFHMSNDNTYELARIVQYKISQSSGIYSPNAFVPVKNATAYISQEPALEVLGSIQSPDGSKNTPLSDLIKNDFDSYDFTNCHLAYWKRAIYIAMPAMGLVLIYDLQRSLWQPPQTIPVGCFSIINGWLYGHSSVTNETYKLFSGTTDNGVFISQVARFAYNNGGRRDRIKNMSQYWSDGYITASGTLNMNLNFGFDGIAGKKIMSISGGDTKITNPAQGSPLGDAPLGENPLGGSPFDPVSGLPGAGVPLVRFWQEDSMKGIDFTEFFIEYTMSTLGGQFALVAHGSNMFDTDTSPVSHKK